MFGTDAMITTLDSALDIDNHGIDPRQELNLISPRTGNHRLVFTVSRILNTIRRSTSGTHYPVFL
jgi:hypothetical protein